MFTEDTNLDEITVNGVPVSRLSAASQKLFHKIVELKKECDELSKKFDQKQAAMKELGDMLSEEVEQIKASETEPSASTPPVAAQTTEQPSA